MVFKSRGILFRTVKYSETSVIADIYTEERGLRSFIVSGVRSQKSKVAPGLMQVMSLVDIVGYEQEGKNLNRLKEIRAAHVYTSLLFDVRKSAIGLFMVEVARRAIRETEVNAPLFALIFDTFHQLDTLQSGFSNIHLGFLVELSAHLGFRPDADTYQSEAVFDIKEGCFTTETVGHTHFLDSRLSALLHQLLSVEAVYSLTLSRDDRRQLLAALLHFYQFHIDNFPEINAFRILQDIF